jgi:hypothetical protein
MRKNEINSRRNKLLNDFNNKNHDLSGIIMNKITYLIKNINAKNIFVDWRIDLITNTTIAATARSFYDAFQMTLANFYELYFLLLFSNLEKHALIDSYLFITKKTEERKTKELYNKIW